MPLLGFRLKTTAPRTPSIWVAGFLVLLQRGRQVPPPSLYPGAASNARELFPIYVRNLENGVGGEITLPSTGICEKSEFQFV